jgi:gamma-D-glutamyl-L-lysine dipeptidyl-peptidase
MASCIFDGIKSSMNLLVACHLASAPMRAETTDRSEMVSQMLFGERAHVLKEEGNWYRIKTLGDQYEGWIEKKLVILLQQPPTEVVLKYPLTLRDDLFQLHRLSPGSLLPNDSESFSFGDRHYTRCDAGAMPKDALDFAFCYHGSPYMWGGRSLYGIDCSGLTQKIAQFNDIALPRDAHQQANCGETINFLEEAQTGDLAFFDNAEGRIIHVGMIIKEAKQYKIIHASGHVRIDTLDHQGIFRSIEKTYSHQLRIIKRLS